MQNHKYNLKKKGWSVLKSKRLHEIKLLRDNFIKEITENKKNLLISSKKIKKIETLRKILNKLNDSSLNSIRKKYLNKFSENIIKIFSHELISIFGKNLLIQKYPQIQVHVGKKNSTKTFPHCEIMAGHSPYTYNIWIPFHDVTDKSGIFLIDDSLSVKFCDSEIKKNIKDREKLLSNKMYFPKIKFGEALIFNPFVYHGSIYHKSEYARISVDARFQSLNKPLFQKYNDFFKTIEL